MTDELRRLLELHVFGGASAVACTLRVADEPQEARLLIAALREGPKDAAHRALISTLQDMRCAAHRVRVGRRNSDSRNAAGDLCGPPKSADWLFVCLHDAVVRRPAGPCEEMVRNTPRSLWICSSGSATASIAIPLSRRHRFGQAPTTWQTHCAR